MTVHSEVKPGFWDRSKRFFSFGDVGYLPLFIILLFILFAFLQPRFATFTNLQNVSRQGAFLAIVACAQMFPMLGGGFDISVGANVGLVSVITSIVTLEFGTALGFLSGILCGALVGLINGNGCFHLSRVPFRRNTCDDVRRTRRRTLHHKWATYLRAPEILSLHGDPVYRTLSHPHTDRRVCIPFDLSPPQEIFLWQVLLCNRRKRGSGKAFRGQRNRLSPVVLCHLRHFDGDRRRDDHVADRLGRAHDGSGIGPGIHRRRCGRGCRTHRRQGHGLGGLPRRDHPGSHIQRVGISSMYPLISR